MPQIERSPSSTDQTGETKADTAPPGLTVEGFDFPLSLTTSRLHFNKAFRFKTYQDAEVYESLNTLERVFGASSSHSYSGIRPSDLRTPIGILTSVEAGGDDEDAGGWK